MIIVTGQYVASQTFSTNLTPVGWEHNILFNAGTRYTVTQQGPYLDIPTLFDGGMMPYYTSTPVSVTNPSVILIEGLPAIHTQTGAWVGWTTRYWPATRFKIEGFDTNGWITFADYSSRDYVGYNFSIAIPTPGSYTKLRFTFYVAENNGNLGVSELFFIHPEATSPYAGLFSSSVGNWQNTGSSLVYNNGNVGIGTLAPTSKLTVAGNITSREVKVTVDAGADFVFENDYDLPSLESVNQFIKENNHLPGIASAKEMEKKGLIYLK